jgi:hypothetical protein
MTEHYIHAASIGASVLPGVTGQAIERQREKHRPDTAGNLWTRLDSLKRQVAMVSLTTSGVKQLLDLMPQGSGATQLPVPCLKLSAGAPLTLWSISNQDDVPLPTAGNVHEKLLINLGAVALRRLSWREPGEPVVATATCWPLSADGEASYWVPSQAALPTVPPVDNDYTLDAVSIGGTPIDNFGDLDLEIDCPWTPGFKLPKSRYPDYLSAAGARGTCSVKIGWRSRDRTLLRVWGEGYKSSAVQTVELTLRNYGQAAERGVTTLLMDLKCTVEATSIEDGRPSTVQVNCASLSTDGANPFRWGY